MEKSEATGDLVPHVVVSSRADCAPHGVAIPWRTQLW
jgi:hypothetical protein